MATWTPHGVTLVITASASNPRRVDSDTFLCDIAVSWKTYWKGANTNFGMKATAGGKTVGMPYYNNTINDSGSDTLRDCSFSISGNATTTADVTVTFTNYKDDTKSKPSASTTLSVTVSSIPQYRGSINVGKTTIQDHGNNTFTITATAGTAANNNSPDGLDQLVWGYSSSYGETYTSGEAIDLTTSGTGNTRKVYAKSRTKAKYGTDHKVAETNADIGQYFLPNDPKNVRLDDSSLKNGRLTVKKNWTFKWDSGGTSNTKTSPIKGYRIRIYKGNSIVTGVTAGSGDTLTINKNGTNEWLDRESTSTTITFNPVDFGFTPGTTVQIGVYAYTYWGNGAQKFNQDGVGAGNIASAVIPVVNDGVVRVKVDNNNDSNSWREGVVWIKVNNNNDNTSWKEADTVQVKTSDSGDDCWKVSS